MRSIGLYILAILAILLPACSAPDCATGRAALASTPLERLAGDLAAAEFEPRFGGVIREQKAESRMARIGSRLCLSSFDQQPSFQYRLLDSDRLNAASLPPGRVYITRALFERLASDDQLAAVIAHEMGHLAARDSFKPRCANAEESLQRELSADAWAINSLSGAGYNRQAMAEVVDIIRPVQPSDWYEARNRQIRGSYRESLWSSN